MRVVFRVEGEPSIGLGHIMRCLALAQSLIKNGHQVVFIMSQRSQQFCAGREDWLGDILPIVSMDKWAEANWLANQCTQLQADWLVLDGYQFDQVYRQSVRQAISCHLAVFDDINNSGSLYADLVINGAPNATLLGYQDSEPDATLAIGSNYQVLRQEFLQINRNNWSTRKRFSLMFGGSDPNNLTMMVLQALRKVNAPMPINIITGAAYDKRDDLVDLINASELDITYHHDCQHMATVLLDTKLALSAAGGSQFELLACATPSVLVMVAENQKIATQEAVDQGWCQAVNRESMVVEEVVRQCVSLWQQTEVLRDMHEKSLQYSVVDGANNIVKVMRSYKTMNDKPE